MGREGRRDGRRGSGGALLGQTDGAVGPAW